MPTSSAASLVRVDLQLAPSVRALRYLLMLHSGLLLLGVWALQSAPEWLQLALVAALALSWWRLRRHRSFGYGPAAITGLIGYGDARWRLSNAQGHSAMARLSADSVVSPAVLVLNFVSESGKRHTRILLGDETDAESLRRLRVLLRNS